MDVVQVLVGTGIGVAAGLASGPLFRLSEKLGELYWRWRHRYDPPVTFFRAGLLSPITNENYVMTAAEKAAIDQSENA